MKTSGKTAVLIFFGAILAIVLASCAGGDGDLTKIIGDLTEYPRVVFQTYRDQALAPAPDTAITLYDADGNVIATGGASSDSDVNREIDYLGVLTTGTYYVRVQTGTPGAGSTYALRVLQLGVGDAIPGVVYPGAATDTNETDDSPDPWAGSAPVPPLSVSLSDVFGRVLTTGPDDTDWFRLDLP